MDAQHLIAMQKACAAVKDEFSNYAARFNTPAKLNNFTLTFDEIDKLAEQIALIKTIAEYMTFKTDCANNVSYLSNIEFIDLGANFKQKLEAAKDEFRSARDSILTGTSGDAAAQKVNAALEKVKEEYIGIYFEEHKKNAWTLTMQNDAVNYRKVLHWQICVSCDVLKSFRQPN